MEHPSPISETVPDESMSMREIMARYTRGMRIDATLQREGSFDSGADFDSPDLEKLRDMDLVEKDEFRAQLREDIAEFERTVEEERKTHTEKQLKKQQLSQEIEKDFLERKTKRRAGEPGDTTPPKSDSKAPGASEGGAE